MASILAQLVVFVDSNAGGSQAHSRTKHSQCKSWEAIAACCVPLILLLECEEEGWSPWSWRGPGIALWVRSQPLYFSFFLMGLFIYVTFLK
jgi:hypothetical protein